MRVLGVDPGTFKMGVGVVDSEDGELTLVYSDVLSAGRSDPLHDRLHYLYEQLVHLIERLGPGVVAVEQPFVARNVRAAMAIGQAQAVAFIAAAYHGRLVSSYSPREIKRTITDYGGSSKEQVQEMVRVLLGLSNPPEPLDASDALATAICHIRASRVTYLTLRE